MKKLTLILLAVATVLTLSQCKKNVEQIEQVTPVSPSGNIVSITLDVSGGGSKVIVDPETGEVSFQQNDVVYVTSGGLYVGKLTCRGDKFMGDLTNPTMNQPLYFYFFGNFKSWEEQNDQLIPGASDMCTVDIGDQTDPSKLPVISCAVSQENFTGEGTYHAFFENRAALVMFNVTSNSTANTCITGMKNRVVVDFISQEYTYIKEGDGVISLPGGSGERWAILLPQAAMPAGEDGSAYSDDYKYTGICGAVPAISSNGYLFEGINVTVNNAVPPTGAIKGRFTVDASGKQVFFSKGNLQYQALTDTWRFAENQRDICGNDNQNISSSYSGWIDLFGWGTSGWDGGNTYYQPYNYESDSDPYAEGYGYGPFDGAIVLNNLTGNCANADWGVYNAISNGGNQAGMWRTLSYEEWDYVINTRTTASGMRYVKANANGRNGLILLPDDWDASIYAFNSPDTYDADYSSNVLGEYSWGLLEAHGAVLLPAAGIRTYKNVDNMGTVCKYWSTSWYNHQKAYAVSVSSYYLTSGYTPDRDLGHSVRLVYDIE